MKDFPDELCGLWIDEIDRGVYIEKNEQLELQTTFIFDTTIQLKNNSLHIDEHLKNRITKWVLDEQRGAKRLQIEVGIDFVGPTYNLYLSKIIGNKQKLIEELNNIELYPEVQMGLYDDWEDDLGVPWAFPYKNYQKATEELEKKLKELLLIK
ncbi:MAG: hypothetical protein FK734_20415 [Asgard group archaeon]|nr:hypothetical protein [Asgard group archaeon]